MTEVVKGQLETTTINEETKKNLPLEPEGVLSTANSFKLEESIGTYTFEPPDSQFVRSTSESSKSIDKIIFYNATTMITDLETNLLMVLWTEHLRLEIICGIIGVVNDTIHLFLDFKLLINCLPKGIKAKDLTQRAIERRKSVVEFVLQYLVIQEVNDGKWILSLVSSELLVKTERRRALSSEAPHSSSINHSGESTKLSQTLEMNGKGGGAKDLTELIVQKPDSVTEYSFQDFSQLFVTIPLNSSDYNKVGIPSLREIMKRQSLAMSSSDAYDQLTNRSIRRHTFDVSLEHQRGSTKSNKANLLGKNWLHQPNEDGTTESPYSSLKLPRGNLPSVKIAAIPSSSIKLDNTSQSQFQPITSTSFLPKIDAASGSQQVPPILSSRGSGEELASMHQPNDAEANARALLSPTEENRKKGHVYDFLMTSDGVNPQLTQEPDAVQTQHHGYGGSVRLPSTNPTNTETSMLGSKSHFVLPSILSPNARTVVSPNQVIQDQTLAGLTGNDNSTGNMTFMSAPIAGGSNGAPRRKSIGNPLPYDRTPLVPDKDGQVAQPNANSLPQVGSNKNNHHQQPRRSFEQLSTSIVSSAIQTLAKGIIPRSTQFPNNNNPSNTVNNNNNEHSNNSNNTINHQIRNPNIPN